ncbi:MAG: TRAP transporter substrate-binding protein [Clostridia bacterium]|nr:TRAP transporter substrate-binding protein [Clostridia bacterium]NCC43207.1 TRAP transporter substrate-binding protein [Clostridia bacterium]
MKKRMKMVMYLLTISILPLIAAGCKKNDTQTYAWPLGSSSPEDTVTQIYGEKFIEEVDRLSEGKMKIQIYANGIIGSDRELLESCADGDIPFVVQNTAPQVSFMPEISVFDLPCAYSEIESVRTAVDDQTFSDALQNIYEKNGYHLLGMADQGFRVMSTNKKIETIKDFTGQKIRTMENSNHLLFWKDLNANPTPMTFSEVYIGLQQNTIDAQENPYEVIVSGKLYEQQKYVVQTNHLPHMISLLVNDEFLENLEPEERAIIEQASATATAYAREQADERVAERISVMEDYGVEIVELSEEVHEEIRSLSQNVYENIEEQAGEELVELYLSESEK